MSITIRLSEPKILNSTDKVKEQCQFNVAVKFGEGQYVGFSGFRLMDGALSPPAVRGARGKYFNQAIFSPEIAESIAAAVRGKTWGAGLDNFKYLVYTEKDHERLFGDASQEADRLRAELAAARAEIFALKNTPPQEAPDTPPWESSDSVTLTSA